MQKCKTLGEETYFEFSFDNNILIVRYGFTKNHQTTIIIQNELIKKVINRVAELKNDERFRSTSFYTINQWKDCPNTIYCPYVAKLIIDVFPKETINKFNILKDEALF